MVFFCCLFGHTVIVEQCGYATDLGFFINTMKIYRCSRCGKHRALSQPESDALAEEVIAQSVGNAALHTQETRR
jgi:hypothetical protein